MLGSQREGDDAWPLRPGTFGAYVVVDDPDALHDRAVAAGLRSSRRRTTPTTAAGSSRRRIPRAIGGRSAPTAGTCRG